MNTTEAFSPSPPSPYRRVEFIPVHLSPLPAKAECPLNPCVSTFRASPSSPSYFEEQDSLIDHLLKEHAVSVRNIPVGDEGAGTIRVEAAVWLQPTSVQQASVLLKFGPATFVWTLESRLRADAEVQASISLQLIEDLSCSSSAEVPETPPTTLAQHLASPSSSSHTKDFPDVPDASSSAVIDRVTSLKKCSEGQPMKLEIPDLPSPSKALPKYQVTVWVKRGPESDKRAIVWDEVIYRACSKKHEREISCGRGLVVLWPTHKDAFDPSPKEAESRALSVYTRIKRL